MKISVFTSRELNQGYSKVTKAAKLGPVVITYHGRPKYVLLSFEGYTRLSHPDGKRPMPTHDEILAAVERSRPSR